MPISGRDTLRAFTERAIQAEDCGEAIPPIVYLPARLRANGLRITEDMLRITINPPTIEENEARVQGCDPLGFLIALMNGQPIPTFVIEADNSITVHYRVADVPLRIDLAKWLLTRRKANKPQANETWEATVARAAALDTGTRDPVPDTIEGEIPE